MKLITEQNFNTKFITEENDKGEKEYFLEGVFMQAEVKNRNGRIYTKDVLGPAVEHYINTQVKTDRAVGELNHPNGPTVNYKEVSHKIESLEWDGNNVIGKAKILNTPNGELVKALLDGGVQIGVSSRGMGSVTHKEGTDYISNDFILNTVDIVQDPSAPAAFVNGIMEGVEWTKEGEEFVKVNNETKYVNESLNPYDLKVGDRVIIKKTGKEDTIEYISNLEIEPRTVYTLASGGHYYRDELKKVFGKSDQKKATNESKKLLAHITENFYDPITREKIIPKFKIGDLVSLNHSDKLLGKITDGPIKDIYGSTLPMYHIEYIPKPSNQYSQGTSLTENKIKKYKDQANESKKLLALRTFINNIK